MYICDHAFLAPLEKSLEGLWQQTELDLGSAAFLCSYNDKIQNHHHSPSTLLKDEQNILICPVAPSGFLKVTDTGAAHPVRICWVIVKDRAGSPVEATDNHKVTLIVWLPAETLLTHRQEAAVFDRQGAQLTRQHHSVDQHYGNVALLQMSLDFLNCHRTFFHYHTFALSFKEELIHSVFFRIKMLLVKGLVSKALIYTQSLCAKAVFDSQMAHEVGQVNSPHALCQLQIPAHPLKLLIADWVEVLEDHPGTG